MTPDPTIIRAARISERGALEELQRRSSMHQPMYRAQLAAHPDAIELPAAQIAAGFVRVAEENGMIAGFAVLLERTADACELDGLFVEPDLWGQGIGRALVDAAAHEARKRGLSLTVIANPSARLFYESCGFTVEGEEQTRFGVALRMSR